MNHLQKPDRDTDLVMQTTTTKKNSPKIPKKWFVFGGLALLGFVLALLIIDPVSKGLEYAISVVENRYQEWFAQQDTANPLVLMPLAFIGGLIASISPCILAMLPLNLSYIGTRNITSRKDAFIKAGMFVLGNVIILSLFGLVSSFAGFVIVEYRGHINVAVGAIILIMGLGLLGLIKIPLPQVNVGGTNFGPFGVGLTYALVSSPCASPVLFLSSLLTGFAKQANLLMKYSEGITKFGSIALILAGIYYLFVGVQWFIGG
jgi:cytochrome c-type biogenesis protein